jgi:hypothetical protein
VKKAPSSDVMSLSTYDSIFSLLRMRIQKGLKENFIFGARMRYRRF